ncbi:MAG: AraC family transcriptional regulator [Gemmatimonadetes bacterium]|nr:AraC family transcriptional regulator [Gemmatimonadota bacterium]
MISLDQAGRAMEWTEIVAPPPRLATWVEHAWITHLPPDLTSEASAAGWKVVPDLSPNLLVHRTRSGTSLRLIGSRTRSKDIDVRNRIWSVGIRLLPGTLPVLAGADARELTDASCDPDGYWGDQEALRASLAEAPSATAALSRLLTSLGALPLNRAPDWRVRILAGARGRETPDRVALLAKRHGVSRRTLQSTALRELGMTPKTALRIRRLHDALRAALSGRKAQWSRIAQATGYCDGAHLSREFRALMREEPTLWLQRSR